jgi:chitinase
VRYVSSTLILGFISFNFKLNMLLLTAGNDKLTVTDAVELWITGGMPAKKIALGMGLYGRAFKLQSPANHDLGAPARGDPNVGTYTRESGFLSFYEVCSQKGLTVIDENPAGAPYGYSGDLWVGFDTPESLVNKVGFLKKKGKFVTLTWNLVPEK